MGRGWKKWIVRAAIGAVVVWILLVLFAHPFFAVTAPSGGRVLVVEGWMHREGLKEAAALYRTGAYDRICVTGTERPFAYYLGAGDTLEVWLTARTSGELRMVTAGLPTASWSLLVDGTKSTGGSVSDDPAEMGVQLDSTSLVQISASSTAPPTSGEPVIFIGGLWLNGTNAHRIGASIHVYRANGPWEDGRPTFAHQAFHLLRDLGIPAEDMTVIPTWTVEDSRTLSTARDFASYARAERVRSFDVATLGVHARRTRTMYRKAFGTEEGIGVIALHDRWCPRWKWWSNYSGWYQVMKELVAWPAPWLIDDGADPAA